MAERDATQDTDQIRKEIEETRQRMDKTMGELETRLNPARLKREATDKIREQTVGRVERLTDSARMSVKGASNDVFETIKENPVPAALAAIGLGWLFMESRNENRRPAQRPYAGDNRTARYGQYPGFERGEYRYASGYTESNREMDRGLSDRARETAGQVQDKAQHVAGQAQEMAGQLQDKAQQVTGQAQEQISEWADVAQEQAARFKSRFEEMLDKNPLLIGAAALALGAAIGLSVPETKKEDELLGSVRDDLVDRAQSTAQETMQKAQQVVEKAGDAAKEAAKDEAQKQNLPTS